jgi:hypothetical protein
LGGQRRVAFVEPVAAAIIVFPALALVMTATAILLRERFERARRRRRIMR